MSFITIKSKPAFGGGRQPLRGVGMGINAKGHVGIAIGGDIAEKLGLIAGDRVQVLWGTEEHLGLMRIERCRDGDTTLFSTKGGKALRFATRRAPTWVSRHKTASAPATVTETNGKSVTVRVPASLFAITAMAAE